jgi:hypothetical protein
MTPIKFKKVKPGEPVTAEWANALYDAVVARTPLPGVDVGIRQAKGGWVPWLKRRTGAGGAGGGGCAALAPSLAEVESVWKLSIAPGYLNNLMPEMGGVPLDADPAPTITISSTGGVYLQVQWQPNSTSDGIDYIPSGGVVIDADIVFASTPPTDTPPEVDAGTGAPTVNGVANFILATIVAKDGGGYRFSTTRPGHRFAVICGEECQVSWNGC